MEPAKGREKAPPPPGPGCPLRGPLPRWRQLCRALEFLPKRPFSPPSCRLHTARRIEPQLHGFRGPSCLAPCPVSPARPTPRGSPLPQGPTPRPPPVASASRPPEEGEGSDKGWGSACLPRSGPPGSGGGGGAPVRSRHVSLLLPRAPAGGGLDTRARSAAAQRQLLSVVLTEPGRSLRRAQAFGGQETDPGGQGRDTPAPAKPPSVCPHRSPRAGDAGTGDQTGWRAGRATAQLGSPGSSSPPSGFC